MSNRASVINEIKPRPVDLWSNSYSLIARDRRVGHSSNRTGACPSCCVLNTSLHNAASATDKRILLLKNRFSEKLSNTGTTQQASNDFALSWLLSTNLGTGPERQVL